MKSVRTVAKGVRLKWIMISSVMLQDWLDCPTRQSVRSPAVADAATSGKAHVLGSCLGRFAGRVGPVSFVSTCQLVVDVQSGHTQAHQIEAHSETDQAPRLSEGHLTPAADPAADPAAVPCMASSPLAQ